MLGDADGTLIVDRYDAAEAYWYALGWRGGSILLEDADVDGDGDVDIRDGFLIDAFRSGNRVPVAGIGIRELVLCDENAGERIGASGRETSVGRRVRATNN